MIFLAKPIQWSNEPIHFIPSPGRPGAIGSTSSKTSATAVWDLRSGWTTRGFPGQFRDSDGRIMLLWTALFDDLSFLQLVFPIQFAYDIYIIILYDMNWYVYTYIIYIHKHIHIYTHLFYTPLFSHGGVSSQTYHGVPCFCKKIVPELGLEIYTGTPWMWG